jgi:hypothetical protein
LEPWLLHFAYWTPLITILRSKKACEFIGEKGRIQGLEKECLARLRWVWKMGDEKWMMEK